MPSRTLLLLLAFAALPVFALDTIGFHNNQERSLACPSSDESASGRHNRFCEIREQALSSTGHLSIDPGQNGGISVKGWDRADLLVRSKIEATSASVDDARALARSVTIHAAPGDVRATGPQTHNGEGWSVSYEIFIPYLTSLTANAHNGGIAVFDAGGEIRLTTTNGGIHLARVSGDVKGETTNGGIHAELIGSHWDGRGLDLSSTNGGASLVVPAHYSAQITASTVNGGVHSDFPELAPLGHHATSLNGPLGQGGAPIHVTTVNGGVSISR